MDPRRWPTRVGLAALWLASRLPWSVQRGLANALGAVAYHLLRVRRAVVDANLRICFPDWSERRRRAVARAHYASLCLGALEVARCWWRKPDALPANRIEGLERLRAAAARGKGVLLVSGHFTTLEITGRMLSLAHPIGCLYRDPNNPVLAEVLRHYREAWLSRAIEMNDLKGLVQALREGEVVWYAPDQAKRTKQSGLLPFFGVPCVTNTATPRLATMTGAAVLTFHAWREADGSYLLRIEEAPAGIPSGDDAADTCRLTVGLEAAILRHPEQYLWVHRRFKARDGLPDAYARPGKTA